MSPPQALDMLFFLIEPVLQTETLMSAAQIFFYSCFFCLQVGCSKVYTSTSDVMTHENFHKKNAQLINDGFQRFRATEDCGTVGCQFYGQKTTHFHCR